MPEAFPGAVITFPMLGSGFSVCPDSTYQLFGRTFYWYGAIIGLGFLLGAVYCYTRGPKDFGISSDTLTDVILIGLPASLVGARLYYVWCHWEAYVGATVGETLWNWARIWEGGSAIPGGLLLMAFCVSLYARRKKIPLGAILDLVVFGLFIGQIIGRWSNFINREYIGVETDIFCRMGLTTAEGVTVYVHPLFLYESLWMLAGFLFLHVWSKKRKKRYDGQITLMYIFWYGLIRFLLEGIRSAPLLIPGTSIRASQVLMGLLALGALAGLLVNAKKPHPAENLYQNRNKQAAEAVIEEKTNQ